MTSTTVGIICIMLLQAIAILFLIRLENIIVYM